MNASCQLWVKAEKTQMQPWPYLPIIGFSVNKEKADASSVSMLGEEGTEHLGGRDEKATFQIPGSYHPEQIRAKGCLQPQ